MERLGPVVATIPMASAAAAVAAARAAMAAGADRAEIRLDRLDPGEDPLSLVELAREMPLLLSGPRDAFRPEDLPAFERGQALGAWVDLPFSPHLPEDFFGLDPSRMVLSWHDFEGTPTKLEAVLSRMRSRHAAAYKVVATARDFPHVLSVLSLLDRQGAEGNLCAFAMGGPGVPSRVLALAWGSCGTYATAPGCEAGAPGQMGLEEFLGDYRPVDLGRPDPLYALAGWPLAHTRTPSFFNRWLARAGLPGRYLPVPCTNPKDLLEGGLSLGGVAVTIPHKEAVASLAGRSSRLVRATGACNTLLRDSDGWLAANTDVCGVRRALRAVPRDSRCLLLGYGGAAAAAAFALAGRGPVSVSGRDDAKAVAFARRWELQAVPWEERGSARWDLLVNATPVGRHDDETPYPLDRLCGSWVLDMVVRPGKTRLLKSASDQGLESIPGEAMLVPQAALQYRLWMGRRPPREGGSGPTLLDGPPFHR
jgi:shikimate dehydrogenase